MTEYFAMLAERVLHDPNSPARNDELYIPVLEALVSSPWLDRWERIAPQHDLRMASQNRIGRPANDFRYTTADGATRRMYDIRAEYLLLFINNPGCNMCKTVREAISASPMLNELIERGKLKVLALFPDEDLTEWQEYRPQIPARWINAYDKGCVVRDRELYDLKAIPALYLLDRDKRVMVKDAVDVGLIEWAIDHDDRKTDAGIGNMIGRSFGAVRKVRIFASVKIRSHLTKRKDYGKEMALYRLWLYPRGSRGTRSVPDVQGRQGEVRRGRRAGGRSHVRHGACDRRRQRCVEGALGGTSESLHGRMHRGGHVSGDEPSGRPRGLSRDRRGLQALRLGRG